MKVYNGETLKDLKDKGYHRISNKYRTIARIDINEKEFESWWKRMWKLPYHTWMASYYMRVQSNDVIENVPYSIYKELPGC